LQVLVGRLQPRLTVNCNHFLQQLLDVGPISSSRPVVASGTCSGARTFLGIWNFRPRRAGSHRNDLDKTRGTAFAAELGAKPVGLELAPRAKNSDAWVPLLGQVACAGDAMNIG
jgi:hypothetical protein